MKRTALALLAVLCFASFAFAGAQTGNISTDVKTGQNTNVAVGNRVEAEQNIGSVEVKDGSKVGNISTTVRTGNNVNVGSGSNVKASQNIGSVKVGR